MILEKMMSQVARDYINDHMDQFAKQSFESCLYSFREDAAICREVAKTLMTCALEQKNKKAAAAYAIHAYVEHPEGTFDEDVAAFLLALLDAVDEYNEYLDELKKQVEWFDEDDYSGLRLVPYLRISDLCEKEAGDKKAEEQAKDSK